jgi:DNA-binding MarR family transcriptional regulator
MNEKIVRRMERIFKGAGNHYRIRILMLLGGNADYSLWAISQKLEADFRTISGHTDRLMRAGLIEKRHIGQTVYHELTPYGEKILEFIKNINS